MLPVAVGWRLVRESGPVVLPGGGPIRERGRRSSPTSPRKEHGAPDAPLPAGQRCRRMPWRRPGPNNQGNDTGDLLPVVTRICSDRKPARPSTHRQECLSWRARLPRSGVGNAQATMPVLAPGGAGRFCLGRRVRPRTRCRRWLPTAALRPGRRCVSLHFACWHARQGRDGVVPERATAAAGARLFRPASMITRSAALAAGGVGYCGTAILLSIRDLGRT